MRKLIQVLTRLWLIGSCDHMNCGRQIDFDDTASIRVCRRCGLVMQICLSTQDHEFVTRVAD